MVDKFADKTAWRFDNKLGPVFTPRFFCCTNPNTLGITGGKEPVAVIDVSPNPAYTGETVNYDGTNSYDPDGSVTGYAWTFESHSPSSGTASSGTLNYGTEGTYTIQLIVTDGTSLKSTPARVELVVKDDFDSGVYVATSNGVYYSDGSSPVSWTAKNTGLSGDDLEAYCVAIDPATQTYAEGSKLVWRATAGGIQVSDDGGATWTEKNPASVSNPYSDAPAPTVSDLTFRQLLFADDKLFVIATWQNGSSEWRSWIYYTTDFTEMRSDTSATITWTEV